jgi:hypothetical protein
MHSAWLDSMVAYTSIKPVPRKFNQINSKWGVRLSEGPNTEWFREVVDAKTGRGPGCGGCTV